MLEKQVLEMLIGIEELQRQFSTLKKIPAKLQKEENKLYQKLRKLFRKKNKEVMQRLKDFGRMPSSDIDLKDIVNPLAEVLDEYVETILENTQEASIRGKDWVISELKKQGAGKRKSFKEKIPSLDMDFEEYSERISKILRDKIFEASTVTIERLTGNVMGNLKESYEKGYGIDKAADLLKNVFDNMEGYELERVARTEINQAQNLGAMITEQELGVEYHRWFTAQDERVRGNEPEDMADHTFLHGQIVRVGDLFSNGLERPGDTSGPIAEWINCRCTLMPFLMPEGMMAPDMPFFYESDLVPIKTTISNSQSREHLKEMDKDGAIKQIIDDAKFSGEKLSEKQAEEIFASVKQYTGGMYRDIRKYQMNPVEFTNTHSAKVVKDIKKAVKGLDDYFKITPKYTNKTVYRGINMTQEEAKMFKVGKNINMKGVTSFSSDKNIAENFGDVIFKVKNKTGVSVKHVSFNPEESEIIMNNNNFKILKITKRNLHGRRLINIDLEEVT